VFEIPGKWCRKNGSRFLRGALSLVFFFGHAKEGTKKYVEGIMFNFIAGIIMINHPISHIRKVRMGRVLLLIPEFE